MVGLRASAKLNVATAGGHPEQPVRTQEVERAARPSMWASTSRHPRCARPHRSTRADRKNGHRNG
eukprot:12323910-Alexandrium_andersonii.AAC.1